MTVGAVSPLLEDGSYRLFVGTAAGEFWSLDPMALAWQPAAATTPTPPAYPPPHATSTPDPPAGSYRPEGDLHQLGDGHKGVSLRLQGLVRPGHGPSTLLRTGLHRLVDHAGAHRFQIDDALIENAFDYLPHDHDAGSNS